MKIKIPYTFNLLMPIIIWSILCSAFLFSFSSFDIKLIVLSLIYIFTFYLIFILRHLDLLPGRSIGLINKNISFEGKCLDLRTEEIKDTLSYLVKLSKRIPITLTVINSLVLLLIISTSWFFFQSTNQILISGSLIIFISYIFSLFFCQRTISFPVKDCRRILIERNEEYIKYDLISLKFKFIILSLLPFSFFVVYFNSQLIIILELLLMVIIIYKFAYSYLKESLREIKDISRRILKDDIVVFASGNLDEELFNLSKAFNRISEKAIFLEKELSFNKKELIKKEEELDKLFKLTINREAKMIELKKNV